MLRSGTVPQARTVPEIARAARVATQIRLPRTGCAARAHPGRRRQVLHERPYLAQAAEHQQLQCLDGWIMRIMLDGAAAAATGQTILGPPLAADQMIPDAYLTGHQAR
jgi:hypothetical protein